MPLGTSAFLLSENRLEVPLARIPWLLAQKPVLGCGEDRKKAPGQVSDSPRKSTAHSFHGEEGTRVGSDRASKRVGVSPVSSTFLFCG